MKTVLLTGGTGYIASHTAVVLLQAGYNVVLFDNLATSSIDVVDKIAKITGVKAIFINGDIRNNHDLDNLFAKHAIDAVVHFAALKSVPQSFDEKDLYFDNNVGGTNTLLTAMTRHNVNTIVFSSSAAVYGEPHYLPLDENHPIAPISPYAETKVLSEQAIEKWQGENATQRNAVLLRYFNPVGAHESHILGEPHQKRPSNLVSYINLHMQGDLPSIGVCGTDWDTRDGTPIRDFIHIMDLADAHLAAVDNINSMGCAIINVGTGTGYTVKEILDAFDDILPAALVRENAPRRQGDPMAIYADVKQSAQKLKWQSKRSLHDIVRDHLGYMGRL